jgi:hypothetical protein
MGPPLLKLKCTHVQLSQVRILASTVSTQNISFQPSEPSLNTSGRNGLVWKIEGKII